MNRHTPSSQASAHSTVRAVVCLTLLVVSWQAVAAPPAEITGPGLQPAAATSTTPRVVGALPGGTARMLLVGYPLSLQRLQASPECRALFEAFGASGETMLAQTLFTGPSGHERERFCVGRTAAITVVGSRVTKLCPGFAAVDRRTAATMLLHEALHQAGMDESPRSQGAPSPDDINRMVRDACGL